MKQPTDKRRAQPSMSFRWVIMLLEHVACCVLIWFPMMRLDYDPRIEGMSVEYALFDFTVGTAWEEPYLTARMVFIITVATMILPLFVKQIPKGVMLLILASVSAVFFIVNIVAYFVVVALSPELTYYGLVPQCFPTVPALLYAIVSVFAIIETVATYIAVRKERRSEQEQTAVEVGEECRSEEEEAVLQEHLENAVEKEQEDAEEANAVEI